MENSIKELNCLNCYQPISRKDRYCPNCSQKVQESKISISRLFMEFMEGFFNLDSRFFHTFFKIWSPGLLSLEYIKGKRKTYLNPVRLFIFSMVMFFAALTLLFKFSEVDKMNQNQLEKLAKSELVEIFDSLSINYHLPSLLDTIQMDTFKYQLFGNVKPASQDTFKLTGNLNIINVDLSDIRILRKDIYHLSVEENLDKYEIKGFKEKLVVGQLIKAMKEPKETIRFAFGNLIWVVILTILLTSFVMKLLYIRRSYYYVEHLIFLFNSHSITFLLFTLLFVLKALQVADPILQILCIVFIIYLVIYSIIAIKRYYGQGIFKSLIKMLIITFSYFFFANLLALFVILGSLLLF